MTNHTHTITLAARLRKQDEAMLAEARAGNFEPTEPTKPGRNWPMAIVWSLLTLYGLGLTVAAFYWLYQLIF